MPINFNISSPTNKKAIIIIAATIDAFSDWTWPTFRRKSIIIGILPIISITANNTIVAVIISLKFSPNFIFLKFSANVYKLTLFLVLFY